MPDIQAPALLANEPAAVSVEQPDGAADIVFVCDHASQRLPRSLGTLGLSASDACSHIAWDIGAAAVARLVAAQLDATLILQNYSRLVIDCNRVLASAGSIPTCSAAIPIPGNENLDPAAKAARVEAIFAPYHAAIRTILDLRHAAGRKTLLVAVHSFTPVYDGIARPWELGIMYGRDARWGATLVRLLRAHTSWRIGDNEPYAVEADVDCTLPLHGESRGLTHVGLEIRQDLLATADGQRTWADRLALFLPQSAAALVSA
jgi:predicted N-formylglutamate amidohydrolase